MREINNTAYVALGSNVGDKLGFLKDALKKIAESSQCQIKEISSIYETRPFGIKNQDNFINAVVKIKTSFYTSTLMHFLKNIEKSTGRRKSYRWGPREIDLDLLFYNKLVYKDDELIIPHKGIEFRDFVLVPLIEIAPDYFHPVLKIKISDICMDNLEKNIIRKLSYNIYQ